jgi:hypothetical protein
MGMNYYLNMVIEALKQKMKNYEQDSDTYKELQNAIELLERGIILYKKLEREV